MTTFRLYETAGADGYPPEWHATIKHAVREEAGHRCVRCGHPYRGGEHGRGEWTPCDERCTHGDPIRFHGGGWPDAWQRPTFPPSMDVWWRVLRQGGAEVEAAWRILTVHHLDGNKLNCRWWNLAALCQRCHLTIQGRVQMERVYPWPHSDWFQPYVAGYYAWTYLGEDLTREETEVRLDELLGLELAA